MHLRCTLFDFFSTDPFYLVIVRGDGLTVLSDTRSGEEGDVSMYESLEDLLPSSRMTRNGRLPTACSTNSLTSPDESFHNSPRDEMLSADCDSLLDSDPRTEEEDGEVCSLELDSGISDSVLQRLTFELEHEYGDVQRIGLHHAGTFRCRCFVADVSPFLFLYFVPAL